MTIAIRCFLSVLISIMAHVPSLQAQTTSRIDFQTSQSQGLWAPGPTSTLSLDRFYGVQWNRSGSFDVGNPTRGNTGARLGGSTQGRFGLDVDFELSSGELDASVSYDAGLSFDYSTFVDGQVTRINTIGNLRAANSALQSRFPDLRLGADLLLDLSARINGKGCVDLLITSRCGSFDVSVLDTGEKRLELVALNRDGDAQVRLLSDVEDALAGKIDFQKSRALLLDRQSPAAPKGTDGKTLKQDVFVSIPGINTRLLSLEAQKLLSVQARSPDIDISGGVAGSTLRVRGEDNFLDVTAGVEDILSLSEESTTTEFSTEIDAGIATLDLSANILSIDLISRLSLIQDTILRPELVVDLAFDRSVMAGKAGEALKSTTLLTGLKPDQRLLILSGIKVMEHWASRPHTA